MVYASVVQLHYIVLISAALLAKPAADLASRSFRAASTFSTTLCCAVLCCDVLCYAMLCYAMLCYAMLCYARLG